MDARCARCARCALGQIRTADTRFRRAVLYPLSYEGGERSRSWSRNTAPEHGTSLIMVENGLHTSGEGLKAPENALSPPLGVREPGYRAGEIGKSGDQTPARSARRTGLPARTSTPRPGRPATATPGAPMRCLACAARSAARVIGCLGNPACLRIEALAPHAVKIGDTGVQLERVAAYVADDKRDPWHRADGH
jgi:hypothetical protein